MCAGPIFRIERTRDGSLPRHTAQRAGLRHAAVHAGQRIDADLQHDGCAEFRPCQCLYVGRIFRLHRQPVRWVLGWSDRSTGDLRRDRRADRAVWLAPGAPQRAHRRVAVHVWLGTGDREGRADELGLDPCALPHSARTRLCAVQGLWHAVPCLPGVHAAGLGADVWLDLARSDPYPGRAGDTGRAGAS